MRVAIHQPNFAPWCGYFAKMRHCDVFVYLDDAQMPGGQSYVYRSLILNGGQPVWLSIPTSYSLGESIGAVRFADMRWMRKHLGTLQACFGRCAHFKEVQTLLEPCYREPGPLLADFNVRVIGVIATYLGLKCQFERSSQLQVQGQSDERLIALARAVGADTYVSGKGGMNYQDPAKFAAAGVGLDVRTYQPIAYDQGTAEFVPGLSILDALFRLGRDAVHLLEYRNPLDSDQTGESPPVEFASG